MINKTMQNSCNLQDYRFDVSGMDAIQFKKVLFDSAIYNVIAPGGNLESSVKFLFKICTALGATKYLTDEQRYDALHLFEDIYSIGKLIEGSGKIENIDPQILLNNVVNSGIIDNILDIEELIRRYRLIFSIMSYIAIDDLAFENEERKTLSAILQSYLSFIEYIVKSNTFTNEKD